MLQDHPLRYALANELHARPFPLLNAPCRAVHLAITSRSDRTQRDQDCEEERQRLIALLDRYGASHPQPGAKHYSGRIGAYELKWEQHTEFVTYTVFLRGLGERQFDGADFGVFPQDWLEQEPGLRMTSALIRVVTEPDDEAVRAHLDDWFESESLAVSKVLDGAATVAGDFRIDSNGHQRFAVFVTPDCGPARAGRVVQRLCEIETYKTMAMLGFLHVKAHGPRMDEIDDELTRLMSDMSALRDNEEATLKDLLAISAQLESLSARMSFRFGATGAYEALVNQRVTVIRESRFLGRQTFGEFMMRRFDPAMRTVNSAQKRLASMTERATRAAELLRTRVEVGRSAQSQILLESMDRRARMQLQLQETVEGLSVVAISYYGVSLAGYLFYPLASVLGVSKSMLTGLLVLPVVGLVWLMVRRAKRALMPEA